MMSIDRALFRQSAGSFASGVTVVTTGRDGSYHGMTASAFTSLSLDPMRVLVCVDRGARTFPVLEETGAFNINILATGQEHLSRLFAGRDLNEKHVLDGLDYRIGGLGIPLINGTVAYFECRTAQTYDGGDHVIFVGEVENAGFDMELEPLLYFRGRYGAFYALPEQTSPVAPRVDLA